VFLAGLYASLFYFAVLVLVIGVAARVIRYIKVPSPLVIPTTPAPLTRGGVALRMVREVALFESLFKSNRWIWLFGYLFHFGMLLALLRHLRYFTAPVPQWVVMLQWLGIYAGMAMVVGLLGLWARRVLVDRVRYISAPSDHLMLALLVGIGISGLTMKYVTHPDIVGLKAFILGLLRFDWQPLPGEPLLILHLSLVITLMLVFPYSKLLHAPGIFFSPTRNMPDNPRERRHLAPWAARLPLESTHRS